MRLDTLERATTALKNAIDNRITVSNILADREGIVFFCSDGKKYLYEPYTDKIYLIGFYKKD